MVWQRGLLWFIVVVVVVVVLDDLAFSVLKAVIRGLSAVNLLSNIIYWASHDQVAPIIFLQGLQLAFAVRRNRFRLF